jgi:hypothetical protein
MSLSDIDIFLSNALLERGASWNYADIAKVSSTEVPDNLFGFRKLLLKSDMKEIWAKWMIESFFDTNHAFGEKCDYAYIFSSVKKSINAFNSFNETCTINIDAKIARHIYFCIKKINNAKREFIDKETREQLLFLCGKVPRCNICGFKFSIQSINFFLKNSIDTLKKLPLYVDYVTLHGLSTRDSSIEVDHVQPIYKGGDNKLDNLQLLCGWCNKYKSSTTNIYENSFVGKKILHPLLGTISTPKPFWLIRALATTKKCEYKSCNNSSKNSKLYSSTIIKNGSFNPINIKILCEEHDDLQNRFIPLEKVVRKS